MNEQNRVGLTQIRPEFYKDLLLVIHKIDLVKILYNYVRFKMEI